jgi:hypothetical protein
VQAAQVLLMRRPRAAMRSLWPWIEASKRLRRNVLTVALANKLARIAWAVLARGCAYQPKVAADAVDVAGYCLFMGIVVVQGDPPARSARGVAEFLPTAHKTSRFPPWQR